MALATSARASVDDAPRERSIAEKRADRRFLGRNFQGALTLYRRVLEGEKDPKRAATLCLKIARLYSMVRDHVPSAYHFGLYMEMGNELPSAADICDYLDALRFLGEHQKAEAVCLHYAYMNAYSRNQRYKNALNALTMKYDTTSSDYIVSPTRANTRRAEYWVGNFKGKPFHAVSNSHFNAPGKIFFHRTRYRVFEERGDKSLQRALNRHFADIPRALQCGPVSFSSDARYMVATEILYDPTGRVRIENGRDLSLKTRLVYASISEDSRRFSAFVPLFPQEEGSSYAHPFLFDDGKSILFSSNMPGGYGGFDLYLSTRDAMTGEWGYPLNLGPTVNTEGDEIFPLLFNGELYFASNGHLGLGGYDLFRARFDAAVVANSLHHLPYPINTPYNDFTIYPLDNQSGYIASDRNEGEIDNIFFYHKRGSNESPNLDRTEQSLLNGDSSPEEVALGQGVAKDLLEVIYFDFDKSRITNESSRALKAFVKTLSGHAALHLVGYADEMGRDDYNHHLSIQRARAVADWLRERDVHLPITIEGKGKIVLPRDPSNNGASLSETIERNRDARRVEIYLILE
jgi:outer membrane protein OmpA-like peptidoglycan-associated protein